MGKRSLYLPDELEARVNARAAADSRSFSNFMQWAAEQVLGSAQGEAEGPIGTSQAGPGPVSRGEHREASGQAASTRAPAVAAWNRVSSLGPSAPVKRGGS